MSPEEIRESNRGNWALFKFLAEEWDRCLDIGSGFGVHSSTMRERGRHVTTIDLRSADINGNYNSIFFRPYDAIWCSHTLEHQLDPHSFLKKIHSELECGGLLGITVPPMKPNLVGGHLSLWTPGLLLYHLILAGFDCSEAKVGTYGYNISVLLRKRDIELPELVFDGGDIETLKEFFPCDVHHGMNGFLPNINW